MRPVSSAVALATCLALAFAPAATAATASATFTNTGETPFIVPGGVTSVSVHLIGAAGGAGDNTFSSDDAPGGAGADVTATLTVTPGEVLFAEVGGAGGAGSGLGPGGGGGNGGGTGGNSDNGGGGGGATDVRTCSATTTNVLDQPACAMIATLGSRLIVAGGGGGAGGGGSAAITSIGGGGGNADGGGGDGIQGSAPAGGGGGGPGTASAGGPAGPNSDGQSATAGMLGIGGTGGDNDPFSWGGGGGGGGGIYGGGGGGGGECVPHSTSVCGSGGGGGGGASGVPAGAPGVSGATIAVAASGAIPAVTFTWTPGAPTVLTGPASDVETTTATLNGTVDPNGSPVTGCHFTIAPAPASGGTLPCTVSGGAGVPQAVSAAATGLTAGTKYTVGLVATSAQGTSTGAAVTFTTDTAQSSGTGTPGSGGNPSPGAGGSSTPTGTTLTLTAVTETHARWLARKAPKHAPGKVRRLPVGTTFAFTLSAPATVTLTFTRGKAAKRVTVTAPAGARKFAFNGTIGRKALAPGTYRVTITAAAGSSTATTKPLVFTIVKP